MVHPVNDVVKTLNGLGQPQSGHVGVGTPAVGYHYTSPLQVRSDGYP